MSTRLHAASASCAVLATGGLALVLWRAFPGEGSAAVAGVLVALAVVSATYAAWHVEPAWMITGGLVLSCFNSNWDAFGLPRFVAPDRLLLLAGLLALLLRAPPARGRPPLRLEAVHVILIAALVWAVGSALAAGTIGRTETAFELTDRFAVPFAVFAAAPFAFRTRRHRQTFLAVVVVFGAYLGLTAVFEIVGPRALVFPRFILSETTGYHVTRARGPFLEADVNGTGLFTCLALALVAAATWRRRFSRWAALAVAFVCAIGLLFTLTRSVWLGAVGATAVTMLSAPELRRWALPVSALTAVAVAGLLALLPGFAQRASERRAAQASLWERANVNAAALAMAEQRPLLGYGLGRFADRNGDWFPLLDDIPQVGQRRLGIHNVFLALTTELGLIGATLFTLGMATAVGRALRRRGPPELRPWRRALLAIALFWFVVANFAPFGQVFPSMIVWLVAGIVLGCDDRATQPEAVRG
jgi:O-antigen ligase